MIIIDKQGLLHIFDEVSFETYQIEDKEVLSFLRNSITDINENFGVRDFIKMFNHYPSLLMIVPEFEEVTLLTDQYDNYNTVEVDCLWMSIGAEIISKPEHEYSTMFFNLNGITKLQENFSLNIPAYSLSLKNVINSKIKIMDRLNLSFEISEEQSFKGQIPFAIQNFTLFDFIAIVSSTLLKTSENDGSEDSFDDIKKKMHSLKGKIAEELGIDPSQLDEKEPVDEETIEENTNSVLKQLDELMNPNKDKE